MAKVGEGDPRWLVENRKDGRNVGHWHWEEKNLLPWCKTKLEELFTGIEIEHNQEKIKIVKISNVSGDAALNIRKGQIILIYDLVINLIWNSSQNSKIEGEIKISDLSSDNTNDLDFKYKVTSKQEDIVVESRIKTILDNQGRQFINQKITQFLQALRTVDCGIPLQDLLESSQKLRLCGNDLFKNNQFKKAIEQYDKAIRPLNMIRANAADQVQVNQAKISCFLNIAACHMKLSEYRETIRFCSKALEIDANTVKALFRRSQAYCYVKEFKEANDDISLAAKIEPQNKEVQDQLLRVQQQWKAYKKKQQQKLGGAFGNLYKDVDI